MAKHHDRQGEKQHQVGTALELLEFQFLQRLPFGEMPADGVDQRFHILLVLFRFATYLVINDGISFYSNDGIHDVDFESMAKLPFVNGRRIMRIEIVIQTLLIYRNENTDPGKY